MIVSLTVQSVAVESTVAAPIGNQNAKKARIWSKAIERAMAAWPERAVSLQCNAGIDAAAFEFVNKMMSEKDLGFFRELGDRIDGKPAQALVGGDDDDNPIRTVSEVVLRAVDAARN